MNSSQTAALVHSALHAGSTGARHLARGAAAFAVNSACSLLIVFSEPQGTWKVVLYCAIYATLGFVVYAGACTLICGARMTHELDRALHEEILHTGRETQ